tara:strand:- start:1338 stop:1535 length:198 start_codon:yes stop_codon:yes gene_type:complete
MPYKLMRGINNIMKIKRNEKCPCGSGKKFKKCHLHTERGKAIQGDYGQPYIDYIIDLMKKERMDQ